MLKYINIYVWQAISILFNFASVFVVTPFISSQPNLYGIYSVIISAYMFISYADLGFLGAGMKYASEYFAQNKMEEEIEIVGFTGAIFLLFSSLFALFILFVSFYPSILFSELSNSNEVEIARKMLVILAISCPIIVFQRIIQIIYGVRLSDYKFQRILIMSNVIKLFSVFFFFSNGKYLIVEYFLFSQICLSIAVIIGLILLKHKLGYNLVGLIQAFRITKKMYAKTKKLAFTSIFLTISWIFYYELDTIAIGKLFGAHSVAIYAIGLTIITYFRSVFGIIFTPFIARVNHFVGLNDNDGLKVFLFKLLAIFLPITLFPVISVYLTVDNFILSWVGDKYSSSIPVAGMLVLSYIFSFVTYPTGILILAKERVKTLYITSALQPVIFWIGIYLTKDLFGIQSFANFKFLAMFIETIVYSLVLVHFLNVKFFNLAKQIFTPVLLPLSIMLFFIFIFKSYLPSDYGKISLLLYILFICIFNLIGFIIYYFTSHLFKDYCNMILSIIFKRIKISN